MLVRFQSIFTFRTSDIHTQNHIPKPVRLQNYPQVCRKIHRIFSLLSLGPLAQLSHIWLCMTWSCGHDPILFVLEATSETAAALRAMVVLHQARPLKLYHQVSCRTLHPFWSIKCTCPIKTPNSTDIYDQCIYEWNTWMPRFLIS